MSLCMFMNSQRFFVNNLLGISLFVITAQRTSLSLAIIPMTIEDIGNNTMVHWNVIEQNLILSALFVGCVLSSMLAACSLTMVSPKRMLAYCSFMMSFFTFIIPHVSYVHIALLVAVRVIIGLCNGAMIPAVCLLIANWSPSNEKTTFSSIVASYGYAGNAVTFYFTGWLCKFNHGWVFTFYFWGLVGFLWVVTWVYYGYDYPDQCKSISAKELNHIIKSQSSEINEGMHIKWLGISNIAFICFMTLAFFGCSLVFYWFATSLPLYITGMHNIGVTTTGLLCTFLFLSQILASCFFGYVTDMFISLRFCQRHYIRIFMFMLGFVCSCTCLLTQHYVNSNGLTCLGIAFLILSVFFNIASISQLSPAVIEYCPQLSGIIYAIANSLANFAGIMQGVAVAGFTYKAKDIFTGWLDVFLTFAMGYFIATVCFICALCSSTCTYRKQKPFTIVKV